MADNVSHILILAIKVKITSVIETINPKRFLQILTKTTKIRKMEEISSFADFTGNTAVLNLFVYLQQHILCAQKEIFKAVEFSPKVEKDI